MIAINSNDVLFAVEVNVEKGALTNCKFFETLRDAYEHMSSMFNVEIDEIAGLEYKICENAKGQVVFLDDMGNFEVIDSNVEEYISNYAV